MEPERIGVLIDQFAAGLNLFARQWCAAPEDVVQDAFVALAGRADEPHEPAAWLYRVVRNGAINAGIAERRRHRRERAVANQAAPWFEPHSSEPASDLDPDAAQAALNALPDPQREVIVAHLWGGLTFEQIAALTGSSSSSAHRLYQTGLQTLRTHLGASCRSQTSSRPTS